jgi:peroxiredoxin (alkyl hydroperoxide reductase subunit C)
MAKGVNMSELKDGCVRPAAGPILPDGEGNGPAEANRILQEVKKVTARVGKEAIDFEASGFIAGDGFKPVKLSDYKGKWIVLCFYPGDFTYV